jgi:hypothetical protein
MKILFHLFKHNLPGCPAPWNSYRFRTGISADTHYPLEHLLGQIPPEQSLGPMRLDGVPADDDAYRGMIAPY